MDAAARLWLCAALILIPPVVYLIGLTIYDRRRRARQATPRPSVADLQARVQRDDDTDHPALPVSEPARDDARLPPGWHWPTRDHDR